MFRLLITLALLAVAFSEVLVANYFTDVTTCATGLSAQAFIQMGKCVQVPDIPPSMNVSIPFKSFKSSCTQNADGSIETSNKIYAASGSCGGLGVPVKETIPAGCSSGGLFTCAADMSATDAVTKAWPAVGLYFGDSGCATSKWDVQAAFAANTCVALSGKSGSGSVLVTPSDTAFSAQGWKDIADCSGAATKEYSVPVNACTPIDIPGMKEQQLEMYKSSLYAFQALLGSTIDLEVSPQLVAWLHEEMKKTELTLQGGASIFAKAGVAGTI